MNLELVFNFEFWGEGCEEINKGNEMLVLDLEERGTIFDGLRLQLCGQGYLFKQEFSQYLYNVPFLRWTMVQQQKSWKLTFMVVVQSTVSLYSVTNLVAILKGE